MKVNNNDFILSNLCIEFCRYKTILFNIIKEIIFPIGNILHICTLHNFPWFFSSCIKLSISIKLLQ